MIFFLSVWDNSYIVKLFSLSVNFVKTIPVISHQLYKAVRRRINSCENDINTNVNSQLHIYLGYDTIDTFMTHNRTITEKFEKATAMTIFMLYRKQVSVHSNY